MKNPWPDFLKLTLNALNLTLTIVITKRGYKKAKNFVLLICLSTDFRSSAYKRPLIKILTKAIGLFTHLTNILPQSTLVAQTTISKCSVVTPA